MNVGATSPEGYGNYFSWGEVSGYNEGKTKFDWDNYRYCANGDSSRILKYTGSDSTILAPEDDAASVSWGGTWRMPTNEEWTELREKCTWEWTSVNGINGRQVAGPNGNRIFLPAAGYPDDEGLKLVGENGYYWSSSLYWSSTEFRRDPAQAWNVRLVSDEGIVGWGTSPRCGGQSIRPVSD